MSHSIIQPDHCCSLSADNVIIELTLVEKWSLKEKSTLDYQIDTKPNELLHVSIYARCVKEEKLPTPLRKK